MIQDSVLIDTRLHSAVTLNLSLPDDCNGQGGLSAFFDTPKPCRRH